MGRGGKWEQSRLSSEDHPIFPTLFIHFKLTSNLWCSTSQEKWGELNKTLFRTVSVMLLSWGVASEGSLLWLSFLLSKKNQDLGWDPRIPYYNAQLCHGTTVTVTSPRLYWVPDKWGNQDSSIPKYFQWWQLVYISIFLLSYPHHTRLKNSWTLIYI